MAWSNMGKSCSFGLQYVSVACQEKIMIESEQGRRS